MMIDSDLNESPQFQPSETNSDWRIIPRLIKGMQALIKAMVSLVAMGTSFTEALFNPGVAAWAFFAYEIASFFFPFLFPAVYSRFTWLDVLSTLGSLAMMMV